MAGKFAVQFSLDDDTVDRLRRIKDSIGAASLSEVVRRAAAMAEFISNATAHGGQVFVTNKEGTANVVEFR